MRMMLNLLTTGILLFVLMGCQSQTLLTTPAPDTTTEESTPTVSPPMEDNKESPPAEMDQAQAIALQATKMEDLSQIEVYTTHTSQWSSLEELIDHPAQGINGYKKGFGEYLRFVATQPEHTHDDTRLVLSFRPTTDRARVSHLVLTYEEGQWKNVEPTFEEVVAMNIRTFQMVQSLISFGVRNGVHTSFAMSDAHVELMRSLNQDPISLTSEKDAAQAAVGALIADREAEGKLLLSLNGKEVVADYLVKWNANGSISIKKKMAV